MSSIDFQELRQILQGLSLREADLTEGNDAVVDRLREFKRAVERLDTTDQPGVAEWLSAEHVKAVMLQTAAKTNRRKEDSDGTDHIFNVRNRAAILTRFDKLVVECRSRLTAYEEAPRSTDVAEWRAALERFRQDPVRNP